MTPGGEPPELESAFGTVGSRDPGLRAAVEAALAPEATGKSTPIGLIGCGWIAGMQLAAYRERGLNVVALSDRNLDRAIDYRDKYYPDAAVYADLSELLEHPGLEVIDIATHVNGREAIVLDGIRAGKHVLSQKPFVEKLTTGRMLAQAASEAGVILAVNQNGRWAPHFGAMLALVRQGLIGEVLSADFSVSWSHDLIVKDMPAFASMDDLILFDFGAHWFDLIGLLAPPGGLEVRATTSRRLGQAVSAPTQANVLISGEDFAGSLTFRGAERFAERGSFRISGTRGVITQSGTSLAGRSIGLENESGSATIQTGEDWFSHGLGGAMVALLHAVENHCLPPHSAASALRGLEFCFAALASARTGLPVAAGESTGRIGGQ